MGLQQEGDYGLRRRLRMALEPDQDYARVAITLDISEDLLTDYLSIPDFQLDPDDYALILSNLEYLPSYTHIRETGGNWRVIFEEKARWTLEDVNAIAPYENAERACVFIQAETYPEDIMTVGPDDLSIFDIQGIIDAAVEGDYDRLITVVWYIPFRRYPYPAQ